MPRTFALNETKEGAGGGVHGRGTRVSGGSGRVHQVREALPGRALTHDAQPFSTSFSEVPRRSCSCTWSGRRAYPERVPAARGALRHDRRDRPLGGRAGRSARSRGNSVARNISGAPSPKSSFSSGSSSSSPPPRSPRARSFSRSPRRRRSPTSRRRAFTERLRGLTAASRSATSDGARVVDLPQVPAGDPPQDRHGLRARPRPLEDDLGIVPSIVDIARCKDRRRGRGGRRRARGPALLRRRLAQGFNIARPQPCERG